MGLEIAWVSRREKEPQPKLEVDSEFLRECQKALAEDHMKNNTYAKVWRVRHPQSEALRNLGEPNLAYTTRGCSREDFLMMSPFFFNMHQSQRGW